MSRYAKTTSRLIAGGLGLLYAGVTLAPAQDAGKAKPPDFSAGNAGWATIGTDWIAMPGSPPPVGSDPAHPYVPNNTGKQPTFRIADLNNPNLTQFAKDALKKANDEVIAGKAMYSRESRCWATGVPTYLLNPGGPTFFVQTPEKVTMIWQMDHQVRHIYLNVPHSANPKPSPYGESVGHYENGDTLVIDTIALSEDTYIDNYRTPHTTAEHVIERFKVTDGGKTIQVTINVDDPGTFNMAWSARQTYHRTHEEPISETICAENNSVIFDAAVSSIPQAAKPDF